MGQLWSDRSLRMREAVEGREYGVVVETENGAVTMVRQAIVFGHPEKDKWTIDAPISKDLDCPKGFKMKIAEPDENGKQSRTEVRPADLGP